MGKTEISWEEIQSIMVKEPVLEVSEAHLKNSHSKFLNQDQIDSLLSGAQEILDGKIQSFYEDKNDDHSRNTIGSMAGKPARRVLWYFGPSTSRFYGDPHTGVFHPEERARKLYNFDEIDDFVKAP